MVGLRKGLAFREPAPPLDSERRAEEITDDDVDRLITALSESVDLPSEPRPVLRIPEADPGRSHVVWPRLRGRLAARGLVLYFAAPILLGVLVGILAARLLN